MFFKRPARPGGVRETGRPREAPATPAPGQLKSKVRRRRRRPAGREVRGARGRPARGEGRGAGRRVGDARRPHPHPAGAAGAGAAGRARGDSSGPAPRLAPGLEARTQLTSFWLSGKGKRHLCEAGPEVFCLRLRGSGPGLRAPRGVVAAAAAAPRPCPPPTTS